MVEMTVPFSLIWWSMSTANGFLISFPSVIRTMTRGCGAESMMRSQRRRPADMEVLFLAWVLFWMAEMNVGTSWVGVCITDAVVENPTAAYVEFGESSSNCSVIETSVFVCLVNCDAVMETLSSIA